MGFNAEILLALFFLIALCLAVVPRHLIKSRKISFFRALFPSWRFFEEYGRVPELYLRTRDQSGPWGQWQTVFNPSKRGFCALVINPSENLRLACHTLLDHTIADLNEFTDLDTNRFSETASYGLVLELTRTSLISQNLIKPGQIFQFKISAPLPGQESFTSVEALVSLEHFIS
jgi:hypothetical protein